MALSEKLKKMYSGNSSEERYYDTITLEHPNFTNTFYLVMDDEEHTWEDSGSISHIYKPMGFKIKLANKGESQQDIQLIFDNTNLQLVEELYNAASDIKTPIIFTLDIHIDSELSIQGDSQILQLKNIVMTNKTITAVASAENLIQKDFPRTFFDKRFYGLYL